MFVCKKFLKMFNKRNANTLSTVTLHYSGAVVRTDVLQRTLLSSAQSDNKANVLSAATGLQLCSDNVSYSTTSALHNTFPRCRWSYKNDRNYKNSTHFSVFNKIMFCWVLFLITSLDSTKMTLTLSLKLGVIFSACILVL